MTFTERNELDSDGALLNTAQPVIRYGLALAIAWIGAMKFTDYEAKGIQPLIANSPLMSWMYKTLSVGDAAKLLDVYELTAAALIASRPISPKACEIGSAMATAMFAVTPTFLVSTPGWEPSLGGFPALSSGVGQFLIKDITLLGAALWSLAEARQASRREV